MNISIPEKVGGPLLQIDYEISEQDFLNGQRLAIKNSPKLLVRWSRLILPLFGVALLLFLLNAVKQQGFSWRVIPGLAFCMMFIALPLLNRSTQSKLYTKATAMHGRLSLGVDEGGLSFHGSTFSSQVGWSNFRKFFEDDDSFVLYQNQQLINIVPKRKLAPEQNIGRTA